jgi:glycine cleavage system aminomethyltransferase T
MKESPLKGQHSAGTTYQQIGDAEVPWRFADAGLEYRSLRESAGLLDLTGLGLLRLEGSEASSLLQLALTKDVDYMTPERSVTGLTLAESGSPLDQLVVYKVEGGYVVETSVGCGTATLGHLRDVASQNSLAVAITDESDQQVVVGVEGPDAWATGLAAFGVEVNGLPFEGVMHAKWSDTELMVSRTGYTSEFGFKAFAPAEAGAALWKACASSAVPAGHEALEVAMLEVRQPRLHREVHSSATVISSGLNWLVDMEKSEFIGRNAVAAEAAQGAKTLTIGFGADSKVSILPGSTVRAGAREIGTVVDWISHPAETHSLGLALVQADFAASGLKLTVDGSDGEQLVQTLSSPYRVPTSWKAVRGQ